MNDKPSNNQPIVSHNQRILAEINALVALQKMRRGPQQSPAHQLMQAVEEAICDARQRCDEMAASGQAGSSEFQDLCGKIARWSEVRRLNR